MITGWRGHRRMRRALIGGMLIVGLPAMGVTVVWASATRATPRSESVTASISLDHNSVRAGGIVRGRVVFENLTSTTKILLRGCKVDGLYAVGFRASDGYLDRPAFYDVGCDGNAPGNQLVAKPGTTAYRFQVRAAYMECEQDSKDELPRSSKYWSPLCLKDQRGMRDVMPALPAGTYTVRFFPDGTWKGPDVKSASIDVHGR